MVNINVLIIPHAGKQYCGDIRSKVFQTCSSQKNIHIFYISAIHKMIESNSIYVYKDSLQLFQDYPQRYISEHTYEWVKDELVLYFPNASITNIFPYEKCDYQSICDRIITASSNYPTISFLVICTTDLIHYGSHFKDTPFFEFPQQKKIQLESPFIQSIVDKNVSLMKQLYDKNPFLCCGYTSLLFGIYIANKCQLIGTVMDYYDSEQSKTKSIHRYSIQVGVSEYVSYVGIVFTSNKQEIDLSAKLGLGCVKSVIDLCISKKEMYLTTETDFLPVFTYWYKKQNGIFVSTEDEKKNTNSCIGYFETKGVFSAKHLFFAAAKCWEDSIQRWKNPISSETKKVRYKIEVLQEKKEWKPILIQNLTPHYSSKGIYLQSGYNTATYLPNVWKQHFSTQSSLPMLQSLAQKANLPSNWISSNPKQTVLIYDSEKIKSSDIF